MTDVIDPAKYIHGEVQTYRVHPMGQSMGKSTWLCLPGPKKDPRFHFWTNPSGFTPNALLYEWGAIFGNLLRRQGLNYGIGGMYMEFENVASPGDPVSVPTFTRDAGEGVEYYNALSGSSDRDYLRVPLVATTMDSTNETNFPKGNRPIFFAQTSGVEGVHGKGFSDGDNSTVFGGALVAFVDEDDPTRDIVLSRFYLEIAKQVPKLSTSEIGFEWRLKLN